MFVGEEGARGLGGSFLEWGPVSKCPPVALLNPLRLLAQPAIAVKYKNFNVPWRTNPTYHRINELAISTFKIGRRKLKFGTKSSRTVALLTAKRTLKMHRMHRKNARPSGVQKLRRVKNQNDQTITFQPEHSTSGRATRKTELATAREMTNIKTVE